MPIDVLAAGAASLPTFVMPAIVVLMIGAAFLVVTRASKRSSEKSRDRYSAWAATAGMTWEISGAVIASSITAR